MDDHDPDDEDTDRRHLPTPAQVRHRRHTVPGGIPVADPKPDPFDWPVADSVDAEVLRRAGRDPDVAVTPAEISAIVRRLEARLRDGFRAPRDDGLRAEFETLRRDFEPHRRFGKWVAGIAGAALIAVVVFAYQRGRDEQHVADEMQRLTKLVDKLETKIEQQTGTRP